MTGSSSHSDRGLDDILGTLPEYDAPDELIARIELEVSDKDSSAALQQPTRRLWVPALATAATLTAAIGLTLELVQTTKPGAEVASRPDASAPPDGELKEREIRIVEEFRDRPQEQGLDVTLLAKEDLSRQEPSSVLPKKPPVPSLSDLPKPYYEPGDGSELPEHLRDPSTREDPTSRVTGATESNYDLLFDHRATRNVVDEDGNLVASNTESVDEIGRSSEALGGEKAKRELSPSDQAGQVLADKLANLRSETADGARKQSETETDLGAYARRYNETAQDGFFPSSGYWANTYRAGDPAIRGLQRQLQEHAGIGKTLPDPSRARPTLQPFDAPSDAALALYVSADRDAVEGPSRVRLQVGIKSAETEGGARPAMNALVVVDARNGLDGEETRRVLAAAQALQDQRGPEDRFSLMVLGPDKIEQVEGESFRHGPVRVALESAGNRQRRASTVGDWRSASTAIDRWLAANVDNDRPPSSTTVLLVSGEPIQTATATFEDWLHTLALRGTSLSLISMNSDFDLGTGQRIARLAHGRFLTLGTPSEARNLIDRELHASSRTVARAVRVNVRLAPGVQLVDVLGSHPLDAVDATRVRASEKAIDRAMARQLGIAVDRQQDEEGLQVLIPSFLADDDHVLLFDLQVAQPGPVADVRLRYKDMIARQNTQAAVSFALREGTTNLGPLQLNVMRNTLAQHFADAAAESATALSRGDVAGARAALQRVLSVYADARSQYEQITTPQILEDEALIREFLSALENASAMAPHQMRTLIATLQLSAWQRQFG